MKLKEYTIDLVLCPKSFRLSDERTHGIYYKNKGGIEYIGYYLYDLKWKEALQKLQEH